jgi:membrane-bound ClpP family serine protease
MLVRSVPFTPGLALLLKMKKLAYILSLFLLLFTGAGAVYGGWSLMTDPSGSAIQLSLHALDQTPFPDFLIPGIVLFICMGLFSLLAIFSMLLLQPHYSYFILAEGILLTGWILIQCVWTQLFHPLQVVMGITGLFLMVCGWILYKAEGGKLCF